MKVIRTTRGHQLVADSFSLEKSLNPASEKLVLLLSQVTRVACASSIPYIFQDKRVRVADAQITTLKIEVLPEHENEQKYASKLVIDRVMFTWSLVSSGSLGSLISVYLGPHAPANGPVVHKEAGELHSADRRASERLMPGAYGTRHCMLS